MEKIGSNIYENEKINFFIRHFTDSVAQWYTVVRDNVTTYQQFRDSFEKRYWNIHTQCQVRDQLEYVKFNIHGRQSIEQYKIAQIEIVIHLKPKF